MTEFNPLFLSIDGGGTKTKVTISTYTKSETNQLKSKILSTGTHRSSNYSDLGIDSAIQSIYQATQKALLSLPIQYSTYIKENSCPFTKIWAGLSGVDSQSDIQIMHNEISKLFSIDSFKSDILEVSNDCDLLTGPIEFHYLESLKNTTKSKVCQGGIVLIAGTGSIVTVYIPNDTNLENGLKSTSSVLKVVGRLGGYGYLIGDEGSAYDVGKRTIKSLLEYSDSLHSKDNHHSLNLMISKSTLIPMVLNHFNVKNLADLLGSVYKLDKSKLETEHDRKIRISEVSRLVMQSAFPSNQEEGDEFALKIMEETAQSLSKLLNQICQLHQLVPNQLVLSLGGGMWGYQQFQQILITLTHEIWDAQWGWIERVNEPDEVAAITLVDRYLKTLE